MTATTKKATKSVQARSKTAKKSRTTKKAVARSRTRVVDEARDRKIIAALKKGVTTSQFRDELKLLTYGSMLSNLRPVAKRHGFKLTPTGKHGTKVYKFVAGR
jgi:hypothetical protein